MKTFLALLAILSLIVIPLANCQDSTPTPTPTPEPTVEDAMGLAIGVGLLALGVSAALFVMAFYRQPEN